MKVRKLNASMTIEMSLLIPLILILFVGIVLSVFYYHDKSILNGAAYETAVLGSQKMREEDGITENELITFCQERIQGKCILLTTQAIQAVIEADEVQVRISARKRKFSMSVMKKAAITEPEKKIRDIRRFEIRDGEKNHD